MTGVALTTAALVIVLSVFNGLEDLLRSLNKSFDPEIRVEPSRGKSFELTPEILGKVKGVDGVDIVTEVIQDYAYVRYRDANQVVTIKGVSENFLQQNRIPDKNIVEGKLRFEEDGIPYAVIGRGVQYTLSVQVTEAIFPLQVYYIKNVKSPGLNPANMYSQKSIMPGGVFSIVQSFDENFVIVPLQFARDLLNYGNKRTYLEIKTKPNSAGVEKKLQEELGSDFNVLNHEEQHKDLYKLLKMEKFFAFLALTLLLIIGSINIFFTLMMLALDKKKDITVLASMGASQHLIRNIYITEGALIGCLGVILGLIAGGTLCWLQMNYGFVSMGMENSVTEGYPVKMNIQDFALTLIVVVIVTLLISIRPALLASRLTDINRLSGKV